MTCPRPCYNILINLTTTRIYLNTKSSARQTRESPEVQRSQEQAAQGEAISSISRLKVTLMFSLLLLLFCRNLAEKSNRHRRYFGRSLSRRRVVGRRISMIVTAQPTFAGRHTCISPTQKRFLFLSNRLFSKPLLAQKILFCSRILAGAINRAPSTLLIVFV